MPCRQIDVADHHGRTKRRRVHARARECTRGPRGPPRGMNRMNAQRARESPRAPRRPRSRSKMRENSVHIPMRGQSSRRMRVGLHSSTCTCTHEFLSCENSSVPATTSWLTKPLGHLDYQLRRSYLLYCSDDMCSVTSVSSSTICGPHAILENYEEYADKIVSTKIANIAVGNFGIDRASEAADAPVGVIMLAAQYL